MKRIALFILLPVLLLYGGCKLAYPTYGWHQKLTLVVETPQGLRSGASVTKHLVEFRPKLLPDARSIFSSIRGEATVVDLGDGRYLFVLLKGRNGLARIAFSEQLPGPESDYKSMLRSIKRLRGVADVPLPDAPLLVTFGDLADPASVMRVDPADLAATFGAGFALREITLEITDDAVTDGVVEGVFDYLNWSSERVLEYSCQMHKCDRSPLRLPNANGTTTILMPSDFISRNIK